MEVTFISLISSSFLVYKSRPHPRALSPRKRKCYYPDEFDLNYFPVYSYANCLVECAWDVAKESCGCAPWFLQDVLKGGGRFELCEYFGNACFKRIVASRYKLASCSEMCLQDCEVMEYSVSTHKGSRNFANVFENFCSLGGYFELTQKVKPNERERICAYVDSKTKVWEEALKIEK